MVVGKANKLSHKRCKLFPHNLLLKNPSKTLTCKSIHSSMYNNTKLPKEVQILVLTFCWTQSYNLQPVCFFSYKLFFPFSCHQIGKKLKISALQTFCVKLNIFFIFRNIFQISTSQN